jgi:uncharacterized protein YaaN involved in tellurite resistance
MTNQKLVLEQISALNTTTAGMIDSTGEMLRTQTGAIHEQAASSTIPLETLGQEVEKSKGYIARAEGVNQAKLGGASSPLTPIESK